MIFLFGKRLFVVPKVETSHRGEVSHMAQRVVLLAAKENKNEIYKFYFNFCRIFI